MEILLKIKQAENPQFNFLSFDNELHPYYRHLLMAVKNEKYKPISTAPEAEKGERSFSTQYWYDFHLELNITFLFLEK